jgi:hypothetical protein
MMRRVLLTILAVFVAWSVLDFVIHNLILGPTYQATAHLWRPMEEMRMGLMSLVRAVAAACFVGIYAYLVQPKSLTTGLNYGVLFGLGTGISMGYGTYSVMPVPYHLALVWFVGTLVEAMTAGVLAGLIVKSSKQ